MRRNYGLLPSTLWLSLVLAGEAEGAQVGGRLVAPAAEPVPVSMIGHSRTRVAQPSAEVRSKRSDVAVFLKVRDSLPIPESNARWRVELVGAQLRPEVVACAVDEVVEFANLERRPVTVLLGSTVLGVVPPGETVPHTCRDGGRAAIKVSELPHVEGSLYVGESVGVAARPDPSGRFTLAAPKGTYELRILGPRGVLATREVSVDKADVDLGVVELASAAAAPEPPPTAPAPAPAPPPPAPVEPSSAGASKVKSTPPPVPAPKPAKLKLEKPEAGETSPSEAKPAPKPKPKPEAKPAEPEAPAPAPKPAEPPPPEARPTEPKGSEEPPPAKLPTPTKPKVEKKAEDDFFELEP